MPTGLKPIIALWIVDSGLCAVDSGVCVTCSLSRSSERVAFRRPALNFQPCNPSGTWWPLLRSIDETGSFRHRSRHERCQCSMLNARQTPESVVWNFEVGSHFGRQGLRKDVPSLTENESLASLRELVKSESLYQTLQSPESHVAMSQSRSASSSVTPTAALSSTLYVFPI